jgi:hypothetical protein
LPDGLVRAPQRVLCAQQQLSHLPCRLVGDDVRLAGGTVRLRGRTSRRLRLIDPRQCFSKRPLTCVQLARQRGLIALEVAGTVGQLREPLPRLFHGPLDRLHIDVLSDGCGDR